MHFRAVYDALGGSDDRDRIVPGEAFHDLFCVPCLEEDEPCRLLGAEEDIYVGKDLFDTFPCLIACPQVPAEVYVKGDERACLFEAADHFHRSAAALFTQGESDPARVEAACGREECFIEIIHGYGVDRGVAPVVDYAGFSRISSIFIVIDPKPCLGRVVIHEMIVADPAETDAVFGISPDVVCGEFGDDPGPEPEERDAGNDVELCAAHLLLESLAAYEAFIAGRGKAEKDFSE